MFVSSAQLLRTLSTVSPVSQSHQSEILLGAVGEGDDITINYRETEVLQASMDALRTAWQGTLDGGTNQ